MSHEFVHRQRTGLAGKYCFCVSVLREIHYKRVRYKRGNTVIGLKPPVYHTGLSQDETHM